MCRRVLTSPAVQVQSKSGPMALGPKCAALLREDLAGKPARARTRRAAVAADSRQMDLLAELESTT